MATNAYRRDGRGIAVMGDGRIVGDGKIELHTTQALGWGSYIAEAS